MSDWKIKDHTNDRFINVEDGRKAGEDKLEDFEGELELELIAPDGRTVDTNYETDDTEAVEPEIVEDNATTESDKSPTDAEVAMVEEQAKREATPVGPTETAVDSPEPAPIDLNDPESHLPGWMLSEIQHGNGDTGIDLNKDGTQVVSGALGLEVNAECEVSAQETDFEYARYRATVVKPDGRTYNAVGDCHIDESGKDKWDLERMAETRAKKRCVKWASSGGIEALEAVRE